MAKHVRSVDQRLGESLRRIRIKRGVSQTEIAESVGVTFQQIQKYEIGANRLSVSRLIDLAKYLNVSAADFILSFEKAERKKLDTIEEAFKISRPGRKLLDTFEGIKDSRLQKSLLLIAESFSEIDHCAKN